jgi:hypothetical protein
MLIIGKPVEFVVGDALVFIVHKDPFCLRIELYQTIGRTYPKYAFLIFQDCVQLKARQAVFLFVLLVGEGGGVFRIVGKADQASVTGSRPIIALAVFMDMMKNDRREVMAL